MPRERLLDILHKATGLTFTGTALPTKPWDWRGTSTSSALPKAIGLSARTIPPPSSSRGPQQTGASPALAFEPPLGWQRALSHLPSEGMGRAAAAEDRIADNLVLSCLAGRSTAGDDADRQPGDKLAPPRPLPHGPRRPTSAPPTASSTSSTQDRPWEGWENPSNPQPQQAFVDNLATATKGLCIATRPPRYEVLRDGRNIFQNIALHPPPAASANSATGASSPRRGPSPRRARRRVRHHPHAGHIMDPENCDAARIA